MEIAVEAAVRALGEGALGELNGTAMITYYDRPLPGIGYSFPELITEQAYQVAASLEAASVLAVLERLDQVKEQLDEPAFYAPLSLALYLLILLAITMARIVLIFVMVFGDAATAVCVLLGPLFIPFFIILQTGLALLELAEGPVPVRVVQSCCPRLRLHLRPDAARLLAPFRDAITFNDLLLAGVQWSPC